MNIALIAKKGGVGKTTLCLLLHEAIRQTGQTVAVRDYDAQGSASKALTRIQGIKEVPGQSYQVLLIDTPPSLTLPATAAAVASADIILIPTSPSPVDVWEADEAARFAQGKSSKAIIRIVRYLYFARDPSLRMPPVTASTESRCRSCQWPWAIDRATNTRS